MADGGGALPVVGLRPPYYAVLFTSVHSGREFERYEEMAVRMNALARGMEGFLGIESAAASGGDGLRITISYWRDEESIKRWRDHAEHSVARALGRDVWYSHYRVRVCRVEREYGSG